MVSDRCPVAIRGCVHPSDRVAVSIRGPSQLEPFLSSLIAIGRVQFPWKRSHFLSQVVCGDNVPSRLDRRRIKLITVPRQNYEPQLNQGIEARLLSVSFDSTADV